MMEVVFRNVTKKYGDVTAARNFNLEVRKGEFMILLGSSGSGKTSALRMLAGLEAVDEGQIFIGSQCVNGIPPRDRNVAMVFQNYALYPHMKVYENLAFDLRVRKIPREEIRTKINTYAALLGIAPLLERYPRQLSGGERQRVALGRAIVRTPNVFLMDEPLSNLDAKLRVQMRAELLKIHQTLKTTTLYVTHDQDEAMTLGQRVAVMRHGEIQQLGTPSDIYNFPLNTFVADFVGSPRMNMIAGELGREGDILKFNSALGGYLFQGKTSRLLERHVTGQREVLLGVRPESVRAVGSHASEGRWQGVLEITEAVGREAFLYFRVGESQIISVLPMAEIDGQENHSYLQLDESRLHFFDRQDGRLLFSTGQRAKGQE